MRIVGLSRASEGIVVCVALRGVGVFGQVNGRRAVERNDHFSYMIMLPVVWVSFLSGHHRRVVFSRLAAW